jgi:choline kinase
MPAVSIAPHQEIISPLMLGNQKSVEYFDLERTARRPHVKSAGSKRLSGRSAGAQSPFLKALNPVQDQSGEKDVTHSHHGPIIETLVDQIAGWLTDEKIKRSRRQKRLAKLSTPSIDSEAEVKIKDHAIDQAEDADDEVDLDRLEEIIKRTLNLERLPYRKSSLRQKPSLKKLRKASSVSSDTDYFDGGEALVPSCDVLLDNSKTLAYTGGASDESDLSSGDELSRVASFRDQDAWTKFKFEIVRLAHTLRLKGWRKVPMEMSGSIGVQRLSGALTNAVYVVSPPCDLPPREQIGEDGNTIIKHRRPPPKLLLRIYGPQVEHLIDRESELAILRRLARKRIGPRLLGTFANGRFEEFFNAETLTPEDLRNPETSIQIAKRMRELHDGIELLEQERNDGPFVWRNWDKWVYRVEQVVSWLDAQVEMLEPGVKPTGPDAWKRRGYICGVPWKRFRETVDKYRAWLDAQYGGPDKIRDHLVFAHNDTQYGNILRLVPSGESPLLLPANTHKQLVVIDFEYSNANLPGLEFANHFTEWCYNYHDKRKPYVCNTSRYPTREEQDRFIRAYFRHRPQYSVSTPKLAPETPPIDPCTPSSTPLRRPTSNISDFMLDARGPHPSRELVVSTCDEKAEKAAEDAEVARYMHETRLWRLANTAQWVAWGIVQAKVPGMPSFPPGPGAPAASATEQIEEAAREDMGEDAEGVRELAKVTTHGTDGQSNGPDEQEEEFDYLGYAQHRAMFFWGDALQWGLVTAEELPESLREKVKTVPY